MHGTWVDNISNFHDLRQELVERESETVDLPSLSRCFLLPRRVLCAAQPQIYRPICNLNEIVAEGNDGSTGGGRGGRVGAEHGAATSIIVTRLKNKSGARSGYIRAPSRRS